jgi:hypothetical protein
MSKRSLTPNVIGVVGGPPMDMAQAPVCPDCRRPTFLVGWIETAVRPYGDGFRSSFICEDCRISTTLATTWELTAVRQVDVSAGGTTSLMTLSMSSAPSSYPR